MRNDNIGCVKRLEEVMMTDGVNQERITKGTALCVESAARPKPLKNETERTGKNTFLREGHPLNILRLASSLESVSC